MTEGTLFSTSQGIAGRSPTAVGERAGSSEVPGLEVTRPFVEGSANVDIGEYMTAFTSEIKARLTLSNMLRVLAGVSLANTWELVFRYELPRLIKIFPDKPLNENRSLFVTIFVLRGTLLWFLSSRLSQDFVDKVWKPGISAVKEKFISQGDVIDP